MKTETLPIVFVTLIIATIYGCTVSTSTPEKTVERFVEGHRRGDEALVLSTLYEARGIGPLKSGRQEKYVILEKLIVLESSDPTSKVGDIQIRVLREIEFTTGPIRLIAYFRLRQVGGEWKIMEYAADTGGEGP